MLANYNFKAILHQFKKSFNFKLNDQIVSFLQGLLDIEDDEIETCLSKENIGKTLDVDVGSLDRRMLRQLKEFDCPISTDLEICISAWVG